MSDLLIFYKRRIMRLLPVFIFIVSITVFAGYLFSPKSLFINTVKYAFFGHMFSVNWLLFSESSNYFDFNTNLKPLLHIWSLSIEEQFYLVLPLIVIFFKRYIRTIVLLSFFFSLTLFFYFNNVDKYYFSTQTRIWQFLIGSILVLFEIKYKTKNDVHIKNLTILSIIFALLFFSKINSHYGSLLICLFTSLFLSIENTKCIISNKFCVHIGLISYSLYLWHQPVIAYARQINGDKLSLDNKLLLILLILVASQITYNCVEKNFRYK